MSLNGALSRDFVERVASYATILVFFIFSCAVIWKWGTAGEGKELGSRELYLLIGYVIGEMRGLVVNRDQLAKNASSQQEVKHAR